VRPKRGPLASAASAVLAILAGAVIGLAVGPAVIHFLRPAAVAPGPVAAALHADLAGRSDGVADFYRMRAYRPVWSVGRHIQEPAAALAGVLEHSADEGLTPTQFHPETLAKAVAAAGSGDPASLARADIAASEAFAAYIAALHTPPAPARMAFVDPRIQAPPVRPAVILSNLSSAPSLAKGVADAERMNPIYETLRAAWLRAGAGPKAALLRINMERARALPSDLGARYIEVNPALQTLWLHENGRIADQMEVIVGKPTEPTPQMIGLIRFAMLEPYWYVPPDLARFNVAPKVLAQGPGYLERSGLQALSDWTENAVPISPETVDWAAVASGQQVVRLRQLPGPDNMMGQLKFMLPNPLGVYLHDTPNKSYFADSRRTDSSGCVRLQNAARLGQDLFGRTLAPDPTKGAEQRVDLPSPVPVYILYLTAQPGPDGQISFAPDIYHRDPALMAAIPNAPQRVTSQASEPAPASAQ
jgi:murein L,D-transpeptidase YcbB/YkuD